MNKPTLRCSSLPRFMTCTNSVMNPHGLPVINSENPTGPLGTAIHEVCQHLVATGEMLLDQLKQRFPEQDFLRARVLTNNFFKVWREASKYMTRPQVEQDFTIELENVRLTGHIDVFHLDPLRAFILDYKTGRQHEDYFHQVAGYAAGVWQKAGNPDNFVVYVTVAYLEDNMLQPYEFTADQLKRWLKEVQDRVGQQGYTVGRKCAYCPLQDSCPAYGTYANQLVDAVLKLHQNEYENPNTFRHLSPEDRGHLIDGLYVLDKAKERLRVKLKMTVQKDGPLDLGGGMRYTLEGTDKSRLNTQKGKKILVKRLSLPVVESISTIDLKDALDAYAKTAAQGKKTKAREELRGELEQAGAIEHETETKLWRRPANEVKLEETP